MSNEKVYGMRFGKIYPLLVNKAEKTEADYRCCMRRARGKYRRTADAGNPVSGQTHRRTCQRKGYGKDTA